MKIVESIEKDTGLPRYHPAYEFAGEPDEIKNFKRNLGSLVLSALNLDLINFDDGYILLRHLQHSDSIIDKDKDTFESLINNSNELVNNRLSQLIGAAAEGNISTRDLWEELESLDEFDPKGSASTEWLTKDGMVARLEDGSLERFIQDDIADSFGDDSLEVKTAKELGLNAEGFQHELVRDKLGRPVLLSNFEHATLGQLDIDGNFEPVVTVLNHDHPLRSANRVHNLSESPETIYRYYKDSVKDLGKAKKQSRGLRGAVRMALGLRPDIKESGAQLLHDNQLKYSKTYADSNLDALKFMAELEDSDRNSLETQK